MNKIKQIFLEGESLAFSLESYKVRRFRLHFISFPVLFEGIVYRKGTGFRKIKKTIHRRKYLLIGYYFKVRYFFLKVARNDLVESKVRSLPQFKCYQCDDNLGIEVKKKTSRIHFYTLFLISLFVLLNYNDLHVLMRNLFCDKFKSPLQKVWQMVSRWPL